jgi:hypothetical protein
LQSQAALEENSAKDEKRSRKSESVEAEHSSDMKKNIIRDRSFHHNEDNERNDNGITVNGINHDGGSRSHSNSNNGSNSNKNSDRNSNIAVNSDINSNSNSNSNSNISIERGPMTERNTAAVVARSKKYSSNPKNDSSVGSSGRGLSQGAPCIALYVRHLPLSSSGSRSRSSASEHERSNSSSSSSSSGSSSRSMSSKHPRAKVAAHHQHAILLDRSLQAHVDCLRNISQHLGISNIYLSTNNATVVTMAPRLFPEYTWYAKKNIEYFPSEKLPAFAATAASTATERSTNLSHKKGETNANAEVVPATSKQQEISDLLVCTGGIIANKMYRKRMIYMDIIPNCATYCCFYQTAAL